MLKGLDRFKEYFKGYEDQYVLIGGGACDLLFKNNAISFRATRDLDIVLIVESLTPEFISKFFSFVKEGQYRHQRNNSTPQFYRFDKPIDDTYPKMIELFSRFKIDNQIDSRIIPIHVDNSVSSLSAILLDNDYYDLLLQGKIIIDGISILKPEYIILFKAKAYLDLKERKNNNQKIDEQDIKKHKNDILRIASELILEKTDKLSKTIYNDISIFIEDLSSDPFDLNSLKRYKLSNDEVIEVLKNIFLH